LLLLAACDPPAIVIDHRAREPCLPLAIETLVDPAVRITAVFELDGEVWGIERDAQVWWAFGADGARSEERPAIERFKPAYAHRRGDFVWLSGNIAGAADGEDRPEDGAIVRYHLGRRAVTGSTALDGLALYAIDGSPAGELYAVPQKDRVGTFYRYDIRGWQVLLDAPIGETPRSPGAVFSIADDTAYLAPVVPFEGVAIPTALYRGTRREDVATDQRITAFARVAGQVVAGTLEGNLLLLDGAEASDPIDAGLPELGRPCAGAGGTVIDTPGTRSIQAMAAAGPSLIVANCAFAAQHNGSRTCKAAPMPGGVTTIRVLVPIDDRCVVAAGSGAVRICLSRSEAR
jgi:hypothetical protein